MEVADLKLDGNAVGGLLAEVFGADLTSDPIVCSACGAEEVLARLDVYLCAPGTVIRCRHCHALMMRIVLAPKRVWVDVSGVAVLGLSR